MKKKITKEVKETDKDGVDFVSLGKNNIKNKNKKQKKTNLYFFLQILRLAHYCIMKKRNVLLIS